MGNPWVGKSHTVPVPTVTAPVMGAGTHRTRLSTGVLQNPCGVVKTRGILILSSCDNLLL
jgi:hypothetical protein